MPTILTKKKDTAGAPAPGDLTNSAGGAELAVNTFDKRLYTKNAGGSVVEIGTNPSTITATDITDTSLTAGRVTYAGVGGNLTDSANLTFNGTTLTANTIGAFTLGGTIAGGGNQINNVIIGASTPLAGSFTTLSASGVATFSAGTVSAPAITTTGDTNTGIYFPAADTMAFTEGGVEAMRINSAGNVGIGTATLAARLTINGGTGTSQTRFEVNTTEVQEVATNAAQNAYANRLADAAQHIWKISSSEAARIDSNGYLGVGTNSPASFLGRTVSVASGDYGASFVAVSNSSALNWARIDLKNVNNANTTYWLRDQSGNSGIVNEGAQPLYFGTSNTERMRIDSSGNVGIGTTSVNTTAAGRVVLEINGSSNALLNISGSGTRRATFYADSTDCVFGSITSIPLEFLTGGVERMRITSAGDVGIGTSSPNSYANYKVVSLNGTTGGAYEVLANGVTIGQFYNDATGVRLRSVTVTPLIFDTNTTERFRIDATGNALFAKAVRATITTDNDLSFDMNAASNFKSTPTAGGALTFTNITSGQTGNIILVNGSNYAITAAATTKVSSTCLATISATGTYWLSYYSDGTNVYVANTGALA
jgi:hypothetical protein